MKSTEEINNAIPFDFKIDAVYKVTNISVRTADNIYAKLKTMYSLKANNMEKKTMSAMPTKRYCIGWTNTLLNTSTKKNTMNVKTRKRIEYLATRMDFR